MRKALALAEELEVVASYCEGDELSLRNRVLSRDGVSELMMRHVQLRERAEEDFFAHFVRLTSDYSRPRSIAKGGINDLEVQRQIARLEPELILCYGSSLIRGSLLSEFRGRFLNLHLGLSPYYHGSGTNVWPLIHGKPEYVGATFMHIDEGIDTGEIIHQVRARIFFEDSVHQIGNRLIADLALSYIELVRNFDALVPMPQPRGIQGRLCRRKDFDEQAVEALYARFAEGLIERYLEEREERESRAPIIENPALAGKRHES
jgi:methionyl-tRNA formyltransferase